jgi:hypothetical protein
MASGAAPVALARALELARYEDGSAASRRSWAVKIKQNGMKVKYV